MITRIFVCCRANGLDQLQLLDETGALTPFVDHEEDVADVHADCALQIGFELDVTTHSFPVAIESKTDQTAVLIEYGATGVTARDVVVR